jgi:ribosome-binding factor A
MAERRPARVAHLVQSRLADLLLRDVKDPRLQGITVTAVRMTPDLRVARIYVRPLAAKEGDEVDTLRALRRATPFLRGEIGRGLKLRFTPELRFEYDSTPDTAQRVEELLRNDGTPLTGGDEEELE